MKIVSMLPGLDDKALDTVFENARRLVGRGTPMQQEQAGDVLAHVEAEQERRKVTPFKKPAAVVKALAAKAPRKRASKKAAAA